MAKREHARIGTDDITSITESIDIIGGYETQFLSIPPISELRRLSLYFGFRCGSEACVRGWGGALTPLEVTF